MTIARLTPSAGSLRRSLCVFLLLAWISPRAITAQALTGTLIGTVKDAQGGVVPGALVRVSSPALIGGSATLTTDGKGQWRFPPLPPGQYTLDVELQGFAPFHEEDIRLGASATFERTPVLQLAGLAESIAVEGVGSRVEARDAGFATGFGPEDITTIPTRRAGLVDFILIAARVTTLMA